MSRVWVEYMIPVLVCVDTKSGEVTRVVQVGEETRASGKAFKADLLTPVKKKKREKATAIAEDYPWPTWESGF